MFSKSHIVLLLPIIVILGLYFFLFHPNLGGSFLLTFTERMNILLTVALAMFAGIEAYSTYLQWDSENKRARVENLMDELEQLYGPIYSALNSVVYEEIRSGILTPVQKKLMDEAFSKEPSILKSQKEWRNRIQNRQIRRPPEIDIPMRFIENFNSEYEERKDDLIEKQFCDIYAMFKNIPQQTEDVGILSSDEKDLIDEKFSTYPHMLSEELYDYWNKEIRPLKYTTDAFEYVISRMENLSPARGFIYLVPKAFITKFVKEYDEKVCEYRSL